MQVTIIHREQVQPSVWSGGKTYEYFIYPAEGDYKEKKFDLRISSATIENAPSNFTKFDGFRRYLVMLDNELKINQNQEDKVYEQNKLFVFNSFDDIVSHSKGSDFNLMLHKDIKNEVVEVRVFPFITKCNFVFVYALDTMDIRINAGIYKMEKGDCLLVQNKDNQLVDVELGANSIIGYLDL